jgi:hypothetical protein
MITKQMSKTIREKYLETIYREYPHLKLLNVATEQMVDWFLENRKDFEKHMKELEKHAKKNPPVEKPNKEVIVECVSKKDATEEDTVFDRPLIQEAGGEPELVHIGDT